jgi:hypothetical protein
VNSSAFTELIQIHERSWGMDTYPGRPSLHELLTRPIVVFWTGDEKAAAATRRSIATVHNTLDELNDVLLSMILAAKVTAQPSRRIQRIFINQKSVDITGVKLLISDQGRLEKK